MQAKLCEIGFEQRGVVAGVPEGVVNQRMGTFEEANPSVWHTERIGYEEVIPCLVHYCPIGIRLFV